METETKQVEKTIEDEIDRFADWMKQEAREADYLDVGFVFSIREQRITRERKIIELLCPGKSKE